MKRQQSFQTRPRVRKQITDRHRNRRRRKDAACTCGPLFRSVPSSTLKWLESCFSSSVLTNVAKPLPTPPTTPEKTKGFSEVLGHPRKSVGTNSEALANRKKRRFWKSASELFTLISHKADAWSGTKIGTFLRTKNAALLRARRS